MAFDINEIIPLNNSSKGLAYTTYNYKTTDESATVEASGYFDDYSRTLVVGDKIEVVHYTSTTPTSIDAYVVVGNTAGVVTTSNFTA